MAGEDTARSEITGRWPMTVFKQLVDLSKGTVTFHETGKHKPTFDLRKRDDREQVSKLMSFLGKRGGPKGGLARKRALSPERRKEIAQQAARKRWGGSK